MKTLVTALALAASLIATPASATSVVDDLTKMYCTIVSGYAATVMKIRQRDGDITEDLALVRQATTDPAMLKMLEMVVEMAYEVPRYRVEKNIARAIVEFKSDVYLLCLKGNRGS